MGIYELLEDTENENVEFKSSLELNAIMKVISAFSNKKGGTILVGVSNTRDIVGIDIGKNTVEKLASDIRRETDPQVFPYINDLDVDEKKVIEIEVSESKSKPVFYRDKAYIRVGRSNQKLSSNEIRNLITNESIVTSWDEQILEDASFEDIDEKKLFNFLKILRVTRNLNLDPNTLIEEALNRLNLTKNGKLTNAAILSFWFKSSEIFYKQKHNVQDLKALLQTNLRICIILKAT